jgi:MFS family permease
VTSVLVQIGTALGDIGGITWIVGAWSIASSVSFSIAGSLSDIFGRRYLIIAGNLVTLIGAVSNTYRATVCDLISQSFRADRWGYSTIGQLCHRRNGITWIRMRTCFRRLCWYSGVASEQV